MPKKPRGFLKFSKKPELDKLDDNRRRLISGVSIANLEAFLEYGEGYDLCDAFTWGYSIQGVFYWADIADGSKRMTDKDEAYLRKLLQDAKETQGIL